MGVVADPELPVLILMVGIVCALIAWLLATFTQFLRGYRYRVALGLIAFPLSGLMGFFSTLNAASVFGVYFVGKPISLLLRARLFRLPVIRLSRLLDGGSPGRPARPQTHPFRALQSGQGTQEAGHKLACASP